MSVSVDFNGESYTIPTTGDTGWGAALSEFLQAVAGAAAAPAVLTFFAATSPADTASNYMRPAGTPDATEVFVRVPFAGTISKLYVQASTGPVTQKQTVTVKKNGSNQTLTAEIAAAATQGADASHEFTVAAGDRISVLLVGTAGIATGAINLAVTMKLSLE